MRTYAALILLLVFHAIANGQSKVDIDSARKMVVEKKYFSALQIVSPCLNVKNSAEISNLDECLYLGEKIAEKAVSDMSAKYSQSLYDITQLYQGKSPVKYHNKLNEIENQLVKPILDLGISPFYSTIGGDWIYQHEFFKTLNSQLPNPKYQDEVEYVLFSSSPSAVTSQWKLWVSGLEQYIKRHPTGIFSLRAKLDLARLYDDLWFLADPGHVEKYKTYLMDNQGIYIDQNPTLANEHRKKALKLYHEIISTKENSSLSPLYITNARKRLIDLPKGIVNKRMILESGD